MPIKLSPARFAGRLATDFTVSYVVEEFDPMAALAKGTQILASGTGGDWDFVIREMGNWIHDPTDVGEEYKLVYSGHVLGAAGTEVFVGYAYSSNGTTWSKGGKLTLGADRASEDPFLLKVGSTYYLFVEDKEDNPFRNIRLYTSTDFATWTDQGDVLDIGTGWEGTDVSSPTVWIESGTWYMLYEGRGTNQAGAIGLATSSDGLTWVKDGSNPIITGVNTNPSYNYNGVVQWSDGIVPDHIRKVEGTYYLGIHGRKDTTDVFNFKPGLLSSTDLETWVDVLEDPMAALPLPDGSIMFSTTLGNFYYVLGGSGIYEAGESAGDANWANVALLLNFYAPDQDTVFGDISPSWHLPTCVGGAASDTAQNKFGPSSLLLDGASDRVTVPDHADWSFGSGDFTVELWARFAVTETDANVFCSQWSGTTQRAWAFDVFNGDIRFSYTTDGTAGTSVTKTFAWTQEGAVWHHIAIARQGNALRAFVDGTKVGSDADVTGVTIFSSTASLWIGAISTSTPANDFNGHMTGLRITKGVARYTANFTAPTDIYAVGPVPA